MRCIFNIIIFLAIGGRIIYGQDESTSHKQKTAKEQSFIGSQHDILRETEAIDICYQRLEFQVNPAVRFIEGQVTTYFRMLEQATPSLSFDLSDSLVVDSVMYHGVRMLFQHSGNQVKVDVSESADFDSLTIVYHGRPPLNGLGSFITTTTQGGRPVMWTLSEPYGARDWWPCRQTLGDKVDSLDVLVTTDSIYKVASNGVLVSRELGEDNLIIFHWRHRFPITPYLVAIAVSDYREIIEDIELRNGTMVLHDFVYPESEFEWRLARPMVKACLSFFDSLLTPYPFTAEKYGHAQFGWGGGMEHQTMSFMVNLGAGLVAHELVHQWFGDWVTCGSWSDIWLNEGFASYLTGMYFERFRPNYWPQWKKEQIQYALSSADGSVFCPDTANISRLFDGRLTYTKSAMVLHMLRKELGTSIFLDGLRNYLSNRPLSGFTRTEHFQQAMEESAGKSLQRFFQQWIYAEGHDTIQIRWNASENLLALGVDQFPTRHLGSPNAYQMLYPLLAKGASKDTVLYIPLENASDQVLIYTGFEVQQIVPDPDGDFLVVASTVKDISYPVSPNSLIVSPNPAKGIFTIKHDDPQNLPLAIYLIDLAGRRLPIRFEPTGQGMVQLNTQGLAAGLYFLECVYPEAIRGVRLVVSGQ
ncbi:MAG: T9SS type A sorting domain-containing protein [Bacteroidia bacterium]|nr:T9SS type A sorting domain-containing protein [Bacteroidia bacterium]